MSLRRFYAVGFLILLVCDTAGQVGFKLAAQHAGEAQLDPAWIARVLSTGWIYLAVGAYVGAFFTWMTLLQHAPIGPAFAASHMEIVSVLAFSVLVLGESLSLAQLGGSALIAAGIAVLGSSEGRDGVAEPGP
jgi:drug/metabolite transporter (DMT)-like permease